MAEIKKLQVDGADIYPVTHESAVYDNEGKSIESKYLSSVAYTQGDDIKIADENGNVIDTSELEAQIEEVEAKIEEVEETVNWCRMALGDGSQLLTNNKNSVVEAINEVFQYGNNVKQNLVDALIAKGVQASTSETFDSLIAKLNGIQSSVNPYNIITASSLPATGEENQLCVLTSKTSSEFYFNASTTTVPSNAITFVCISGNKANYSVTSDNVIIHYNIVYSEQNGTVKPVYLYKNGQWVALALATSALLENGIINSSVNNFFQVDSSYNNYWKYTQGKGLYTSGINNSYYSSVTTTQLINFSNYNSIQVTGYLSMSSTYGLALHKSTATENSLITNEAFSPKTDYKEFSTTSRTYTYDISSWTGSGYLGLVKYNADRSIMYITDIKLMSASVSGDGSGVMPIDLTEE